MPSRWTEQDDGKTHVLTLWPHQSLPPQGIALFVLITFGMIILPLFGLLGTSLLWALLPFLLLAVGGIWYALNRSRTDRNILEVLTITRDQTTLRREEPRSNPQHWDCKTYWVKLTLHPTKGPVPNYITLQGSGRTVELGAFLGEDERVEVSSQISTLIRQFQSQ